MALVVDSVSWLLLLGGCFFLLVGGIGVLRLPDFFTRLHAASVTDTLGAGMILVGLVLQAGWTLIAVKLVLILLFLMITSPTAAYVLARAALSDNVKPWHKADQRGKADQAAVDIAPQQQRSLPSKH